MGGKRFLTIFRDFEVEHIHKDVGSIPYHLATVCGWRSSLAYFEKQEGSREKLAATGYGQTVSLICLGRWRGRFRNAARIVRFLATHGKEYDVVNFYHDGFVTLLYALLFKILRPGGVAYFKLDMNHIELRRILEIEAKPAQRALRRMKHLLSRHAVDIYTAETAFTCGRLATTEYFRRRLHYLPNGFHFDGEWGTWEILAGKENIILTVGRLGDPAKNNEVLVDALAILPPEILGGWKVYFVGPMVNEGFQTYAGEVARRNPHLRDVFVFTGKIGDRNRLYDIFRSARIFCMTSRWESFGFVYLEAMFFGNYLISSDLPAPRELTRDGAFGSLFPVGDSRKLSEILSDAITGKIDLERKILESRRIVKEQYDWRVIVKDLDRMLGEAAARLQG